MKRTTLLVAGLSVSMACNNQSAHTAQSDETKKDSVTVAEETMEKDPSLTLVWETDTVLITSESVLYHPEEDVLYVSNIIGQPTDQDGVGSIAKLSTSGEVMNKKLITGLDAPKGMAINGNTLYVTNIDELVAIDLGEYTITGRYPVKGAKFLNDAVVYNNVVYFSDMETGKLHKFESDKVSTVKENLGGINGLAVQNGKLLMLTEDGLQRLADDRLETVNSTVTGGDGLVVIDDNTYLASRWQGEIWLVKDGEATKLLDTKEDEIQTADIGYIPEQNLVLVPRFFSNKVTAYRLDY